MHIFAADEHPPPVRVYTSRRALLIPRSAGFHDIADERENGGKGERAQMAAVLPFLEGPASRGQLMNRAASISDGGAGSDRFGCRRGRQATSLTSRGERPCDHVSPF
jgi:hypothetical protein